MVADVFLVIWRDPNVTRVGRSGQKQHGVDIYGRPEHLDRQAYAGVQCKRTDSIRLGDVEEAVAEAEGFRPPLAEFAVATTSRRDASLQESVRLAQWPFPVNVMFWEDISLRLSGDRHLMEKHFPGYTKTRTAYDDVTNLIMSCHPDGFSYDDRKATYTCLKDVDLRIVIDRTSDPRYPAGTFDQPWVRNFVKWPGSLRRLSIEYGSSRIATMSYVDADEGRYMIPMPRTATDLRITPLHYQIARIVNRWCDIDVGLARAGIVVDENADKWP